MRCDCGGKFYSLEVRPYKKNGILQRRRYECRKCHNVIYVAEVDEKAGVVPLGADPHVGEIRDDARSRCAPAGLAGGYVGELGFVGPAGMGFEPGPGVCADKAAPPRDAPDAAPGGPTGRDRARP